MMKLTNVGICKRCGSESIGTKDSRYKNDRRVRSKYCKACGARFMTVEISMDDMYYIENQMDLIESISKGMNGIMKRG